MVISYELHKRLEELRMLALTFQNNPDREPVTATDMVIAHFGGLMEGMFNNENLTNEQVRYCRDLFFRDEDDCE